MSGGVARGAHGSARAGAHEAVNVPVALCVSAGRAVRVAEGAAEGASAKRAWGEGCAVGSAFGARRRAGCGEAKAGTDPGARKRAFGLSCTAACSMTVGGVGRACGTSLGTREVRMLRAVVVRGSRACTDGRKAGGKHSGARPLLGAFVLQ